jgi:hypothetical protein
LQGIEWGLVPEVPEQIAHFFKRKVKKNCNSPGRWRR